MFAVAALAALALAVPASLWLARGPEDVGLYERLGAEIGCQCGTCPNRPIATCGCSFADGMLAELQAALDAGQDSEQVLASFTARYGPGIRIKPRAHGLDLAAWLAPMAFLLVGGVVVAAVIARWHAGSGRRPEDAAASPVETVEKAPAADGNASRDADAERLRAIVERELGDQAS